MRALDERTFHWTMGAGLVLALLLETLADRHLPGFAPPTPGFVTFAVGLSWIGRFAAWRSELAAERERALTARVERLQRIVDALDDELRARHRDPLDRPPRR